MIGPAGVTAALTDCLYRHLPDEVDRLADELGVVVPAPLPDDPPVPDLDAHPRLVTDNPIPPADVSIEFWPFTVVTAARMLTIAPAQPAQPGGMGGPQRFTCRYELGVVSFGRGDGYTYTQAVRNRLMLATRETLLRYLKLDAGTGSPYAVLPTSLRESYAPTVRTLSDADGDVVAAGRTELQIDVVEQLTRVDPGWAVEGVDVSVRVLPLRQPPTGP